jgi:hypothetical protein
MTVSIKSGAEIARIRPEILLGLIIVNSVFTKYNVELVVTEGTGGAHMNGSLHYSGLAVDIRSKHIIPSFKGGAINDCRVALGEDFDFILEAEGTDNEHLHLEYQVR